MRAETSQPQQQSSKIFMGLNSEIPKGYVVADVDESTLIKVVVKVKDRKLN